jgi:Carboxypeptidase regulatory-like domain/TonB dependent receptor-like, beta-barrel
MRKMGGSRVLLLGCLLLFFCVGSRMAAAQSVAALNGTVRDPSGAVIDGATIMLTNVNTGVSQSGHSNSSGAYSFVNILPGHYVLEASREGFRTDRQPEFSLEVNQTATINFSLHVGAAGEVINVSSQAIQLETSTSELGTVVATREVQDLPLNGRNFTELLLLTPGASPANPLQNAGGAPGAIGAFSYPAINGQSNRSNMYLLDGVSNYGGLSDTNTVQPTIDDVLEFKVQSHNDEAQFGQVLGGIVNLATKSGSNAVHGSLWEFFRNDALDANNYFNPKTDLKQNQFGAAVGGPVVLPHYNGRNRTFFYGSYEGFRRRASSSLLYVTPTSEQLNGDFSAVGTQIYNPYSTQPDPANPGSFINSPFMCDSSGDPLPVNSSGMQGTGTPCNMIPSSLLNPSMLYYAKTLFPAPIDTGVPGFNGRDSTENIVRSDQMSARIDQQFGDRDRIFFRYTASWQPNTGSGGIQGNILHQNVDTYNIAASWSHTFKGSAVTQFTFGRVRGQNDNINQITNAPSDFLQNAGFVTSFTDHTLGKVSTPLIPTFDIGGYLLEGNFTNTDNFSNIYEYKSDSSKMIGRHLLKFGGSLATDNRLGTAVGSVDVFDTFQTSSGSAGQGGDSLSSMLLGLPTYAEIDTVYSKVRGGKIFGGYFEDQWRVNDRLTLNLGIRYDVTDWPREGTDSNGSSITGNIDLNNGTYVLQHSAPACSATQGAPCIPGGNLPPHVLVSPDGRIIQNTYDNVQPRVGAAYRVNDKTVVRGGYGRFYDNWAAVVGFAANFTQSWPNVAFLAGDGLNNPTPNAPATDPLNLGNGPISPSPDPFGQGNGFLDPNLKNAYSDQYNVGFQRSFGNNSVFTVNYVGSRNHREQLQMTGNTALTPGPGDPQLRAPFPYIQPQNGYVRSVGKSNYNALQVSSEGRSIRGLTYKLAYTYSKVINFGCDMYGSFCDVQDPYHFERDKGVAGFDLTHIFSSGVVYELPFGTGRRWSTGNAALDRLVGGWQLNGILSLSSGRPYDVQAPIEIANTNNISGALRPNIVGDPNAGTSKLHPLNVNAFVLPAAFTFGNMGRNSLRSDWNKDLDISLFRSFLITESKRLEFRFEAFNITNTPVFAIPDNNITDSNFGQVSSTANIERQLQLALKFYF